MSSTRAADVAEVLWELKRAGKVATFSAIAKRAGFSAGADGKAIRNCILTIRRDWPHLQWWRAIDDAGSMKPDAEQTQQLTAQGIEFSSETRKGKTALVVCEEMHMVWDSEAQAAAANLA